MVWGFCYKTFWVAALGASATVEYRTRRLWERGIRTHPGTVQPGKSLTPTGSPLVSAEPGAVPPRARGRGAGPRALAGPQAGGSGGAALGARAAAPRDVPHLQPSQQGVGTGAAAPLALPRSIPCPRGASPAFSPRNEGRTWEKKCKMSVRRERSPATLNKRLLGVPLCNIPSATIPVLPGFKPNGTAQGTGPCTRHQPRHTPVTWKCAASADGAEGPGIPHDPLLPSSQACGVGLGTVLASFFLSALPNSQGTWSWSF